MIPTLNYVPITTKRVLFRNRRNAMIGESIVVSFCCIMFSIGNDFPWWAGFIPAIPFIYLLYWLTYKKNMDILYIGPGTTAEMIAKLPEQ